MADGSIKSYLEIGSYAGESLMYMVPALAPDARIVLVDLGDNPEARTELLAKLEALENDDTNTFDIHLVTGYSETRETLAKVSELCPPRGYDLGFIDGNHDFAYVIKDLENYGPLCSFIAMHDIDPRSISRQITKHGFEKPCAAHAWKVLKLSRTVDEFIDTEAEKPMGIGVLRGITIGR